MAPHPYGFDPARRLHFRWEYVRFFDRSTVFRLKECTVFRIPNHLDHYRLGITFKARGSSVERNRVKRQVREAFRCLGPHLGAFDFNVVIPKHKKMNHPYPFRLGQCLRGPLVYALSHSSATSSS